jgi:hypothetical protein
MQHKSLEELLRFRRCRDLHGNAVHLTVGRRNGKSAVFIHPSVEEPAEAPEPREFCTQERLFVNLNPLERQTWRKILCAQSINSIAEEEGVSRQAVYARIQGNRRGQGGMISKNAWVFLWWWFRQRLFIEQNYV